MRAVSQDKKESRGGTAPIVFAFDARNKSIVPSVFANEAKRLKRFFARKPKVSLHQLETALNNAVREEELRRLIPLFTQFYIRSENAHQYLESLGRLLLEGASKEQENGERQWFLLNQAIEILSLGLQKSPKSLNVPIQSIIVSIYRIMGISYQETYLIEKEIHKEMLTMVSIKKDPNDFSSRERLIKLYLKGRKFYEALVHTAEYEKIMQKKSRSLYRQKIGEIAMRKAGIFQHMIDFYFRIRSGTEDEGVSKVAELGKLGHFITRFNRDNKRISITPLKGMDSLSLNKSLISMMNITNTFYGEAANSEHFPTRHKPLFLMARNSYQFENTKAALQSLNEGVRVLDLMRIQDAQRNPEKLKFLEFLFRIYADLGHKRKAEETNQEIAKIRRDLRMGDGSGGG